MTSRDPRRPPSSRQALARFLDLVEQEARAVLRRRGLPLKEFLQDAIQDGFEGLPRALDRFQKERGSFEAYARPFVRGAVIDALDRRVREDPLNTLLAGADLGAADFLHPWETSASNFPKDADPDAALELFRKALRGYQAAQVCGALGAIQRLDPETLLVARREYARAIVHLQRSLAHLSARDQKVLSLRTIEDRPWDEVALRMGAAKTTVQRWHRSAMDALSVAMHKRGVEQMPKLPGHEDDETEEEE